MKQGVVIVLDKPRTLRFGMKEKKKIESITGKSVLALDMDKLGVRDLLAIAYGGLYHEDKTLTIEKVGNLIDEHSNIVQIAERLGEALSMAFGSEESEDGAESGEM